jgi:hypothetical protein
MSRRTGMNLMLFTVLGVGTILLLTRIARRCNSPGRRASALVNAIAREAKERMQQTAEELARELPPDGRKRQQELRNAVAEARIAVDTAAARMRAAFRTAEV